MSGSSTTLALVLSVVALAIYGYSTYYMNFNPNLKKTDELTPAPLRQYGKIRFLTYQCLLIQVVNALLHVLAHFNGGLVKLRDFWFTCFAYPVGSVVVYSFWAVWFTMGRELIFPAALSQYCPDWLNHSTHTIIVPINMMFSVLVNHKYKRNACLATLLYFLFYTCLLFYIKNSSGVFVYRYLETMGHNERMVYFAATGLFAYLMYKTGQFTNWLCHKGDVQRPPLKKRKENWSVRRSIQTCSKTDVIPI